MIKRIFYKTKCFGKDKREINIYKIRTMHDNEKENGCVKTDIKYLYKILINIFIKGVRSN